MGYCSFLSPVGDSCLVSLSACINARIIGASRSNAAAAAVASGQPGTEHVGRPHALQFAGT
jgi:hypothetical protein